MVHPLYRMNEMGKPVSCRYLTKVLDAVILTVSFVRHDEGGVVG